MMMVFKNYIMVVDNVTFVEQEDAGGGSAAGGAASSSKAISSQKMLICSYYGTDFLEFVSKC